MHWEEIPPEGLPDWGYDADALVMLDTTLTMMENTGCPSIAFANEIYTISFTHDPTKVVEKFKALLADLNAL